MAGLSGRWCLALADSWLRAEGGDEASTEKPRWSHTGPSCTEDSGQPAAGARPPSALTVPHLRPSSLTRWTGPAGPRLSRHRPPAGPHPRLPLCRPLHGRTAAPSPAERSLRVARRPGPASEALPTRGETQPLPTLAEQLSAAAGSKVPGDPVSCLRRPLSAALAASPLHREARPPGSSSFTFLPVPRPVQPLPLPPPRSLAGRLGPPGPLWPGSVATSPPQLPPSDLGSLPSAPALRGRLTRLPLRPCDSSLPQTRPHGAPLSSGPALSPSSMGCRRRVCATDLHHLRAGPCSQQPPSLMHLHL